MCTWRRPATRRSMTLLGWTRCVRVCAVTELPGGSTCRCFACSLFRETGGDFGSSEPGLGGVDSPGRCRIGIGLCFRCERVAHKIHGARQSIQQCRHTCINQSSIQDTDVIREVTIACMLFSISVKSLILSNEEDSCCVPHFSTSSFWRGFCLMCTLSAERCLCVFRSDCCVPRQLCVQVRQSVLSDVTGRLCTTPPLSLSSWPAATRSVCVPCRNF